jgi:hypothetical protein
MANYRGLSGLIKVITSPGTPATVSEVTSWSAEMSTDALEDTAVGDSAKTFVAGLKSGTISIEGHYDLTDGAQADLVEGASVAFGLWPEGGAAKYSGTAIVSRLRITNDGVGGMVGFAAELQITGAVT